MSYYDALEDKIPIDRDNNGFTRYYPPCHVCSGSAYSWRYIRGTQYVCQECRQLMVAKTSEKKENPTHDKRERRLKQAIKRISKVTLIKPYEKAIRCVEKYLDKPGWFQSTEEIMVALELVRHGIHVHHQVRIFEYSVDFVLPEYKVALEVDGAIFHGKEKLRHQQLRDEAIIWKLGCEWEVIRISTDNINTNITKLVPAIQAVIDKRAKQKNQ